VPLGTVYIYHAVERYCTTTAVGLIVPPSIEGFVAVVAAGGPPLLLLCGVVLCVVRWRRVSNVPQITITSLLPLIIYILLIYLEYN